MLWRVLLAVLGFFGGIGILVYVAAWLIIPNEGDTASPVESMLGRGRSSMSPVTVIVLGILVAASFGYIVTDAFRAVLLGAAILVAGALLLNRDSRSATARRPGRAGAVRADRHPARSGTAGGLARTVVRPGRRPPARCRPRRVQRRSGVRHRGDRGRADRQHPGVRRAADQRSQPSATEQPVSGGGPGVRATGRPTTVGAGWPAPARAGRAPATPSAGWPSAPVTGAPAAPPGYPAAAPPSGYRPPFAPHGPYASPTPAAPRRPSHRSRRSAPGSVRRSAR